MPRCHRNPFSSYKPALYRCLHTKLRAMQKNVRYIFHGVEMCGLLREIQGKAHSGLWRRILHSSFPSRGREWLLILRIDRNSSTLSSSLSMRYDIKPRKLYIVGKCDVNYSWRKLFLLYAKIYPMICVQIYNVIFITKVVKAALLWSNIIQKYENMIFKTNHYDFSKL